MPWRWSWPIAAKSAPAANRAAAGTKISRPWKVALIAPPVPARVKSGLAMARASASGCAARIGVQRPLSGPMKMPTPGTRSASARRAVPTPGSMTATWILPSGQ